MGSNPGQPCSRALSESRVIRSENASPESTIVHSRRRVWMTLGSEKAHSIKCRPHVILWTQSDPGLAFVKIFDTMAGTTSGNHVWFVPPAAHRVDGGLAANGNRLRSSRLLKELSRHFSAEMRKL